MDIELKRNDFQKICDNIHFFMKCEYYILDCEAEKERLILFESKNIWGRDHQTKHFYAHQYLIDFFILKFPILKDKFKSFKETEEYNRFNNYSFYYCEEAKVYKNFSDHSEDDLWGDSSYIIKSTMEEHNKTLLLASISKKYISAILNILNSNDETKNKITKSELYDENSEFNKEFILYFKNQEEEIPSDWSAKEEYKKRNENKE